MVDKDIPLEWKPSPEVVAKCLKSPLANVKQNLPAIYEALEEYDIHYYRGLIAVLATISVEARTFKPIHEYGGPKYFLQMYDIQSTDPKRRAKAIELGNTEPGWGIKYAGRGYVQITGHHNYKEMGQALGIDLVNDPDKALEPVTAARILARYCRTHGVDVAAQKEDWKKVRRKVNGGLNHFKEFMESVENLKAAYAKR